MNDRLFEDLPPTAHHRAEGQRHTPSRTKPTHKHTSIARTNEPSLDPPQITVEVPFAWTPVQEWRFRGCREERTRWLSILPALKLTYNQVKRYARCGDGAWIQHSASRGTRRIVSQTCHSRACPVCRATAARQLQQRLDWALPANTGKNLRLVTLTMKHTRRPLREQLDHLRESFRRLRQRRFWKRTQAFGFAVIEVGYNEESKTWHPHLHVITHGRWIHQQQLSNEWAAVTHGSRIVDVRAIRNRARALSYVLKYMAKGPELKILSNTRLMLEWFDGVRRGRLFLRFGRELKTLPTRVDDGYPNDWTWEEPLNSLLERVARGDPHAQHRLENLHTWEDEAEQPYDYLFDEAPP